jgi:hypothetical protein
LGRLVRYRLSDVQRFIAQRPALRSTADRGDALEHTPAPLRRRGETA